MLGHCFGACCSAVAEGKINAMNKSGLNIERETAVWKTVLGFMVCKDLLDPLDFPYMIPEANTDL